MSVKSRITGLTRAETCARITELMKDGLTTRQTAERLGVAYSTVRELIYDPDGSKQKARRERYRGTCSVCGKPTDGSNGKAAAPTLCIDHMRERQHAERRWTRETIIRAFRRFQAETGRVPRATDTGLGLCDSMVTQFSGARIREMEQVERLGLVLPSPWVVQREFGSWAAALEAAGMTVSRGGASTHRRSSYRKTKAEVKP